MVQPTAILPDSFRQIARTCLGLLLLTTFWASSVPAVNNLLGGAEPLAPEVAFAPSISGITDSTIKLEFQIAEGYYLYRDKTHFTTDKVKAQPTSTLAAQISLGEPIFPKAIVVDDEFFGEMATYRNSAEITLPYQSAGSFESAELTVNFQGCADIGLCYPPTTVALKITPPNTAALPTTKDALSTPGLAAIADSGARSMASPTSVSTGSESLFASNRDQNTLLPPELAYLPQIISAQPTEITVRWFIEPGYYLYRDKLSFALNSANSATLSVAQLSPGIVHSDEFFGDVTIYRDTAEATLLVRSSSDLTGVQDASLQINYQGCADIGVCFPPSVATLPVSFDSFSASTMASLSGADRQLGGNDDNGALESNTAIPATSTSTSTIEQSEQDRLFSMLGANGLWLNVITFFGLGLLLAFTPCVLPMIPILSSLIVGQGESMSTAKAFRLSLVYVLVMASTYAVVGIIVGLSGYNVQAFLQNPWVLSSIAVLFIALSLSMFGFYELQMPASVQTKLTQWSNKQGGGQVTGVAAMGFISTLIVGPCVTAPLAGALIYIAKTGDALIGGAALFALGLGMGAPLLLIGTSAGKLVPRAGAWMNATKHIFGILMLAMAIYMVSRFLPVAVTMALYGILALMSGIYLGATDTVNRDSSGWQRFGKGAGIVVAIYGLALLVGALAGGSSYTTPLRNIAASSESAIASHEGLVFLPVKGLDGLEQVVTQARSQGRPLMLDFYADWCISCKEMEAYTFTDSDVQAQLKNVILIQADVTANDAADQALLKQFDLFGPPGIIFFNKAGDELPAARLVGFVPADQFSNHIQNFIGS